MKILATKLGYPFVEPVFAEIDRDLLALVPARVSSRHSFIPVARKNDHIVIAFANPLDLEDHEAADQAYFSGLLHDIGKLVLLSAMQAVGSDGEQEKVHFEALVLEVISSMHVEQGLRRFDEWRLLEVYRAAFAEHHAEEPDAQNMIVALVKLANKGCRKIGLGLEEPPDLVLPATGEAQALGIDEIAPAEFEIMLEDRFL